MSWLLRKAQALFKRVSRGVARMRFIRSVQGSDIFVATYPKSGTTWVGYFLALVVADRCEPGHGPLTLGSFRQWVPGINEDYRRGSLRRYRRLPRPRIFTLHASYDPVFRRVVYLVRDPRAVAVSYYYYRRQVDADFEVSLDAFVQTSGVGPFDWAEHVRGWLNHPDPSRVLVVRYEDLVHEPNREFKRIAQFCGLGLSEDAVARYVERSSFENMRRAELSFEEKGAARDIPFVRRGEINSWEEELSEASVQIIENRYASLMRRMGYDLATATEPRHHALTEEEAEALPANGRIGDSA